MKNIVVSAFLMVMSVVLMSCSFAKSELKEIVEEANKDCPVDCGMIGELSSVKYDEDDNEVIMTLTMSKDIPLRLSALEGVKDNIKRATIGSWADSESTIELMKKIAKAEAKMTLVLKYEKTGESLKIKVSSDEVNEVAKGEASPISQRDLLEIMVASTNVQCPMQVDEATELESVALDGGYFIYNFSVDENTVSIENIEENKENVKATLAQMLKSQDPTLMQVVSICKSANVGILYRYVGDTSGYACDIKFRPSEL